ncbi:unnamed protein product [Bubo scandiacus]
MRLLGNSELSEGEMEKISTCPDPRGEFFCNSISNSKLCGQTRLMSSDTRQMGVILEEARFDFLLRTTPTLFLAFLSSPTPWPDLRDLRLKASESEENKYRLTSKAELCGALPPPPARKDEVKEPKDVEGMGEEAPYGDSLELKHQAETSTEEAFQSTSPAR